MNFPLTPEFFMREALKEARQGYEEGEVPIGSVVVYKHKVIARSHNQVERLKDPTAHAEMLALTQAATYLDSWRLEGCQVYATVEPCIMCAGALTLARVDRLIFGVSDPKFGAFGSRLDLSCTAGLNHYVQVERGVLEEESRSLMQSFFQALRGK